MISSEHSVDRSNRSSSKILLMIKDVDGLIEENEDRKFCNLSSTLELICVWEKKLYEEVMVEEKLRVIYDKECKMLKSLDDRGAEPDKIDEVNASIRSLLSKIDVSVTAIDVISRRINSLRDEELHPQLTGLAQGLTRMWSVLSECHLKQFRVITGIKACVHMANADIRKGSSVKATQKLENDITNWGTCFFNYIDTQKAFVKSLNEWLMRCKPCDPVDAVDDNVSFSPSKIEAPPIFSLCRDWLHAIERVSETGVREAIHASASKLQSLQEMLVDELNQRLITENLSKDFNKHMRLHYNNNMPLSNFDTSDFTTRRGIPRIDELDEDLVLVMNRLNEQKALHEKAIKQVNDAASTILQECLVPIFEALETFYDESLNAYKHVIITTRGEEI